MPLYSRFGVRTGTVIACLLLAACTDKVQQGGSGMPPPCSASGFAAPLSSPPSPGLDGRVIEVAIVHNALVYDACRNVYYASVPGSEPSGNSVATIDATTGQVALSSPVGSEPNALAMAADGSVLYVGLDGTGDVVKLALPSMTQQGRTRLINDGFPTNSGQTHAETIAVSPVDPTVVAVPMAFSGVSPAHAGVALLRDMVLQPKITQKHSGSTLVVFDRSGTTLYGLDAGNGALLRIQVLLDGLAEQPVLAAAADGFSLSFADGRLFVGERTYDASALVPLGAISGATACLRPRPGGPLVCLKSNFSAREGRLLVADADAFVIKASLVFAATEPVFFNRRLVAGPDGQVAIGYPKLPGLDSRVLLFSSDQLLSPPTPPAVVWPVTPSATPDGQGLDIAITHNALVYDGTRNRYYASVPGSVIGAGNTIATIDPATGQVTQSRAVGSEPDALALAPDGSALYVGLDGTGEVVKLALPSMAEQARVRLLIDPFFGQAHAQSIAVSPADPTVVAVAMMLSHVTSGHAGVALLRNMAVQPTLTNSSSLNNLLAFDPSGTVLYGLTTGSTGFGLHANQVLADGLVEQSELLQATVSAASTFSFSNNRLIAGSALYNAPALTAAGRVSGQSDCIAQRSIAQLACFATTDFITGEVRVLLADPVTFVVRGSLQFTLGEALGTRAFVEGPDGQVAGSFPGLPGFSDPKVRLFSSAQLITPPTPPAVSWPVTSLATADGQTLTVGVAHKALVYDRVRNLYYASVPGSVVGAGNTIASIDPATGGVAHSAPIGSDPNPLAIAADGSALYVGLDGSGEVLKLALPSMTETGRVRLPVSALFGQPHALAIAVSPVDPNVAAVSSATSPLGIALLRNLVVQPQVATVTGTVVLLAFDSAGTTLYGSAAVFGFIVSQVLADGLLPTTVSASAGLRSLEFANSRLISGPNLYGTPALGLAGTIAGASDCWPDLSGNQVLCFGDVFNPGRVLIASSTTFVIGASLLYAPSEPDPPRHLIRGPSGQIGISYVPPFAPPSISLFTSTQLP